MTSTVKEALALDAQMGASSENQSLPATLTEPHKEAQGRQPTFLKRGYRACYTFLGFRKSYNFPLCEFESFFLL